MPAKALWWRLEPHLGSLTADHVLPPTGHRLRPVWADELTAAVGEMDAERIMSDRLWPAIVAHVDRAVRDGNPAEQLMPAVGGLFTSARPTVGAHEMATVLLWQISKVTDPAPPDPEFEAAYPDPEEQDLHAPADAHQLLDPIRRLSSDDIAPAEQDSSEPAVDPFDVDRYAAAAAAVVDVAYTDVDVPLPVEPDEYEIDGEPVDEDLPPADLRTALPTPEPARQWVNPEPPAVPVAAVDPDVAPVVLRTAEQEAALGRARAAITAAQQFWTEQTPGSWVPAYIASRGLDPADFLFAPAGWTRTMNHLKRQGFTEDELKAAGLITLSVRGTYIDVFQDRAVTGIHDPATGEIVAFSGRAKPGASDRTPKYVNSPTTDLFNKSELPLGLSPANVAALRAGADLLIVEGPMDAFTVNRAFGGGGLVAIAASGLSFTQQHIDTINAAAPNPDRRWLLALDNDKRGQEAIPKIYQQFRGAGIDHPETIHALPTKDANELLETQGIQAVRDAYNNRRPLAELLIDNTIAKTDISNGWVESRWRAMRDVVPIIAALPREEIIDQTLRAADLIGWDTSNAIDMVAREIPPAPWQPTGPAGDLGLPPRPTLSTRPDGDAAPAGPSTVVGPDLGLPPKPTLSTPRAAVEAPGDLLTHDEAPATDEIDEQQQPFLAPEEIAAGRDVTREPTSPVDELSEEQRTELLDALAALEAHADVQRADLAETTPVDESVEIDTAPAVDAVSIVDVDPLSAVDEPPAVAPVDATEEDAAVAWLQASDPDAHVEYVQLKATGADQDKKAAAAQLLSQYRNHTASEAETEAETVPDVAPSVIDVAAVDQPVVDAAEPTEPDAEAVAAAADEPRPYEDLPDQVLAEQVAQVAAEYADAERVATNAAANLESLQAQVEHDRGPEVARLQARHLANQQRLEAMKQALAASEATDAAQAKATVLGVKVMEAEQDLNEARGNRRRLVAQQRLDQATAAYERQRDRMLQLDAHSTELTDQLGTESQQREALELHEDKETYRQRLTELLEQARRNDREAVDGSRDWVASSQQRQQAAAEELAQLTAEQNLRAEHPDPAAELRRQQNYELQQEEAAEAAGWEYTPGWDPDLDLPPAPDTSIER